MFVVALGLLLVRVFAGGVIGLIRNDAEGSRSEVAV